MSEVYIKLSHESMGGEAHFAGEKKFLMTINEYFECIVNTCAKIVGEIMKREKLVISYLTRRNRTPSA